MLGLVSLEPLSALPERIRYGIHDSMFSVDPKSIYQNTPLQQGNCHAANDPTRRDPRGCGHCVGFGCKHLLLMQPTVNIAPKISGSDIYHRAQTMDEWAGTSYQGTSVRAGLKALQSMGYIGTYVWTSSVYTVAQWLLSGRGPVIVGTSWYQQMFSPWSYGGFLVPAGSYAGGHCWVLDEVDQTTRIFGMTNSWNGWNSTGRAKIRWNDLQMLFNQRPNAAASATEFLRP
jgi:hypothetical protein